MRIIQKMLDGILGDIIVAKGINYVYNQEIERRMEYYNSQMINANMAAINAKIQNVEQKYIKDTIANTLNGTSIFCIERAKEANRQFY